MDQTAYPFVSRICLTVVIGVPLSLTIHTLGQAPGAGTSWVTTRAGGLVLRPSCSFLAHRVQAVALDLRVKLLQDARTQRLPELWCDKIGQLHVRVVFICPLGQDIVVQGGTLLALQ